METIDQLNAWLERPVYDQGILLYQKLIGTGFVLSMLKRGADDYNRATLTKALSQKRDELTAAHQARTEDYPEPLTSSLDAGKLLMDERTALKERLRVYLNSGITEGPDLKDCAFRILAIRDELGGIYGRKSFFDTHGYLPEVAFIDADRTPAQLMQRRLTLRTYVSRETKKLERLPQMEAAYPETLKKLQAFQSELHQVEQELAALTKTDVPV